MAYPKLNPLDWSTVQPHVDALLATGLNHENVRSWLQEWSDLASVLHEARTQIYRDVAENTADEEAEKRFLTFVEQIIPQVRTASQALKNKLLSNISPELIKADNLDMILPRKLGLHGKGSFSANRSNITRIKEFFIIRVKHMKLG